MKRTLIWAFAALTLVPHGRLFAQTFTKSEAIEYHDDTARWSLNQVKRRVVTKGGESVEVERTEFDGRGQPWKIYEFGKLKQVISYHASGEPAYVTDPRNHATAFMDWKRGIPQSVIFPGGTARSAHVNDDGTIASITDEAGSKTCYDYDAMGRLRQTIHPSKTDAGVCDPYGWHPSTIAFEQVNAFEAGVGPGHWRRVETTGNARKVTVFDAMWRPVAEDAYDLANVAGTRSLTYKRYDVSGRLAFQSYPTRTEMAFTAATEGVRTSYDTLGRTIRSEQNSELGVLATTTEYLPGLQTRTTDSNGHQTTNGYVAYDQPGYDLLAWSAMPEGAMLRIERNVVDKPLALHRYSAHNSAVSVTRHYRYDHHMQLCRTIEPESGSTVIAYDASGNVGWSAGGLALPVDNSCHYDEAIASNRASSRAYDARNRLTDLYFPDGRGNQSWSYTADGLPARITTYNDPNNQTPVVNTYAYDNRRMLVRETSEQPGWYAWALTYAYDGNGSLASQSYPSGLSVSYAPNALGQPTHVISTAGETFASQVVYHPNGAIHAFRYGNGVVHAMAQNARQLPASVVSTGVSDFRYQFDANGNVKDIFDHARGSHYNRHMYYDGLDRLTAAGSWSFGGDAWQHFTYDAVDNIRSWKLAGVKDYADYYYNPTNNRLEGIRNSAGATVVGLSYDEQGNLDNKNGRDHDFDFGNRLRAVHDYESYRYDGHGRRVLTMRAEKRWQGDIHPYTLSVYSQAGQVMFEHTDREVTEHVYLAGSLIGDRIYKFGTTGAVELKYVHTDALGSPVATTNSAGQVISRTDWEPYGAAIGKPGYQGVGYTGHVMDGATGLTYMQQRYYDPSIGRFLSVDPVTASNVNGSNFNRYWYANNNPYRFTDPDGRQAMTWGQAGELFGKRLATAGVTSAADGPLPVGEVVGAIILVGTAVEVGYKIYQTADTPAAAGDKVKDGTTPARGVSGKKGERENSGGQEGAAGAFDNVDGTNERSPRPGVRVKDLEGGGAIETHGSTKSPDYPQGTPTVKVTDADKKPVVTVRYPEPKK